METECAYCGAIITADVEAPVPAVDDDDSWAELATEHGPDCEWIGTRAHRVNCPTCDLRPIAAGDSICPTCRSFIARYIDTGRVPQRTVPLAADVYSVMAQLGVDQDRAVIILGGQP